MGGTWVGYGVDLSALNQWATLRFICHLIVERMPQEGLTESTKLLGEALQFWSAPRASSLALGQPSAAATYSVPKVRPSFTFEPD